MGMSKTFRLTAAAVLLAALSACIPETDTVAEDVSRSSDKVIIVGAFEITPKIPQRLNTDQRMMRPVEERLFGSAEDLVGDRLVTGFLPFGTQVRPSMWGNPWVGKTHSVPLDDLFFIEVERTALQMQPGQFFLSDWGPDSIVLPGGLVTATHPTADVVYVGTVRYRRDDFFAITDVRVLDRFSQAAAAVRSRYGANTTIAKSLWRPDR